MNTRIAPSPTGFAHLGTFRTAYFNWLVARATGGKFIFRVDDTDTERNRPETVQPLFDTMKWLDLDYDLIYYQSQCTDLYKKIAEMLVDIGKAIILDNGAIELIRPDKFPTSFHDTIAGDIQITNSDIDHMKHIILLKGNGQPTYHFASVVDDMRMGIDWIIRGKDHISNTPRQIVIWKAINGDVKLPKFTHIGLITVHKKKMSKRDNTASMLTYRDAGYDPDAMLNFMLLLGWSIKDLPNIITKEMAIDLALQGKFKSSDANFDQIKLDSFDRKYKSRKKFNQ